MRTAAGPPSSAGRCRMPAPVSIPYEVTPTMTLTSGSVSRNDVRSPVVLGVSPVIALLAQRRSCAGVDPLDGDYTVACS